MKPDKQIPIFDQGTSTATVKEFQWAEKYYNILNHCVTVRISWLLPDLCLFDFLFKCYRVYVDDFYDVFEILIQLYPSRNQLILQSRKRKKKHCPIPSRLKALIKIIEMGHGYFYELYSLWYSCGNGCFFLHMAAFDDSWVAFVFYSLSANLTSLCLLFLVFKRYLNLKSIPPLPLSHKMWAWELGVFFPAYQADMARIQLFLVAKVS